MSEKDKLLEEARKIQEELQNKRNVSVLFDDKVSLNCSSVQNLEDFFDEDDYELIDMDEEYQNEPEPEEEEEMQERDCIEAPL